MGDLLKLLPRLTFKDPTIQGAETLHRIALIVGVHDPAAHVEQYVFSPMSANPVRAGP